MNFTAKHAMCIAKHAMCIAKHAVVTIKHADNASRDAQLHRKARARCLNGSLPKQNELKRVEFAAKPSSRSGFRLSQQVFGACFRVTNGLRRSSQERRAASQGDSPSTLRASRLRCCLFGWKEGWLFAAQCDAELPRIRAAPRAIDFE